MANVLKTDRKIEILNLLVEGNSIRSVNRLTGAHLQTILDLMVRFGGQCRDFMDDRMQNLTIKNIQCDEIWTFVAKKQARLTIEERGERGDIGDMFLWTCVDRDTKLVPTFAIGKRSADMARRLMVDLRSRLQINTRPHASDAHAYASGGYQPVIQVSTDGFAAYPEAVDLAFGPYAKFGVIIKQYKNAHMQYDPSEMVGTERRPIRMSEGEARTICTSHVERNNLTIRTFMRRYTRLALGFSKKWENLESAVNLHIAYYNFCWRPGEMRITPAMAAGVTNRLWRFDDLLAA